MKQPIHYTTFASALDVNLMKKRDTGLVLALVEDKIAFLPS